MRLEKIYDLFIEEGIKTDPRDRKSIRRQLQTARKSYNRLTRFQKAFFDKQRFINPYADTRILHGSPRKDIRRILVGIDIGVSELLLADQLCRQGCLIDLVLSHHPQGQALSGLVDVMSLQTDLLRDAGISQDIAADLMSKRIEEVFRRMQGANYARVVDAAKMLDIPFMSCHTAADNHVASFLQNMLDARKPKTLENVLNLLLKEPEYRDAAFMSFGPQILMGKSGDKAGRIFVDMTGGTEGSKEIFGRLSQLGIATVVGMHFSEAHYERLKKEYIKVINAGHMASDSLGMNLLLDKLREDIEIVACSGFRRHKR